MRMAPLLVLELVLELSWPDVEVWDGLGAVKAWGMQSLVLALLRRLHGGRPIGSFRVHLAVHYARHQGM